MSGPNLVKTVPVSSFDFDHAPLFGQGSLWTATKVQTEGKYTVSGESIDVATGDFIVMCVEGRHKTYHMTPEEFSMLMKPSEGNPQIYLSKNTGHAVRVMEDATVVTPDHGNIQVKKDGFLFKSDIPGLGHFYYDAAEFKESFSRVLCNGKRVGLWEDRMTTQLFAIREAEDQVHMQDFGKAAAQQILTSGRNLAGSLLGRASRSETAKVVRETADELKQGFRDTKTGVHDTVKETVETVGTKLDAAIRSDTTQRLMTGLKKAAWFKNPLSQFKK